MKTLNQIEQFLKRESGESKLLMKQLHDDVLKLFPKLGAEKLLVENLNNQQVWNQLNRHLEAMTPVWGKYLKKSRKEIDSHAEDQMVDEDEEDGDQQIGPADEAEGSEQEVNVDEEAGDDQGIMQDEGSDAQGEGQEREYQDLEMEDEDVGLYGDQLDDEDDDSEEEKGSADRNPLDGEQDDEFAHQGEEGEDDNLEAEQFEHFREVEQQNEAAEGDKKQQQQNGGNEKLDEISKLEQKLLDRKDWRLKGEVQSRDRPLNSLIDTGLQFKRSKAPDEAPTEEYNSEIEKLVKQRILDQLYDDRVRYEVLPGMKEHFTSLPEVSVEKNAQSLGELYEKDFKNLLGLKEDKTIKLKKEIMQEFKELSYKLECLSNFNFVPKPVVKEATITSQPFILNEQRIPITVAKDSQNAPKNIRRELRSEKEMTSGDRAAYRLKNKRLARQRKKEKDAKRTNRSIEFGGQTKFEAQARKKIAKNARQGTKIKYSQSSKFFGALQQNTAGKKGIKPNPNINKLKM